MAVALNNSSSFDNNIKSDSEFKFLFDNIRSLPMCLIQNIFSMYIINSEEPLESSVALLDRALLLSLLISPVFYQTYFSSSEMLNDAFNRSIKERNAIEGRSINDCYSSLEACHKSINLISDHNLQRRRLISFITRLSPELKKMITSINYISAKALSEFYSSKSCEKLNALVRIGLLASHVYYAGVSEHFELLPNLKSISFKGEPPMFLPILTKQYELERFKCEKYFVTWDCLATLLREQPSLRRLEISHCSGLCYNASGSELTNLKVLRLEELFFLDTNLQANSLRTFLMRTPNLRKLEISNCRLNDINFQYTNVRHLEELVFSNSFLLLNIILGLLKINPKLRKLELRSCKISCDDESPELSALMNLEELVLKNTEIPGLV